MSTYFPSGSVKKRKSEIRSTGMKIPSRDTKSPQSPLSYKERKRKEKEKERNCYKAHHLHPTPTEHRQPLPNRRTEESPRSRRVRIRNLNRRVQIIHIVIRHANPPPTRHGRIGQIGRQDNHNRANRQPGIQTRRRDVVEPHPPPAVSVPDVLVEHVAHDPPREVVERGRRRDLAAAAEDEGRGQVAEVGLGEGAREAVEEDGRQGAREPEPLEVGVDGARGEDALGPDEPPDDGGVEEDAAVGAVEFVGLVLGADVGDGAAEGPFQDGDLHDAGPEGGDGLGHEHGAPGDLHVLAQFEVLGEVEALGHGDVAVGLEEHHGYRTAGLDVAGHELPVGSFVSRGSGLEGNAASKGLEGFGSKDLREDVEANLDAGHALDETDGDEPDDGDDDGDEESPPMHVGRISQAHGQRYSDHDDEHGCVPPLGYIFVFVHHSRRTWESAPPLKA